MNATQFASVRQALSPGPVQVIAVTGGKGGVGKTTVAVNLATAFAAGGRKVMLLDGDLGLANVDVLLGVSPKYTLAHLMSGERTLDEIIVQTAAGLQIVPGASGIAEMASLTPAQHLGIVQAFSALSRRLDVLIIDTAAGIADGVLRFSQAAQEVLLVVCDEPASLTDAYALVKVLNRDHGVARFRVLANRMRATGQGQALFAKLERVTSRFLDVTLDYAGEIPEDPYLQRSIREQRPVYEAYPACPSAQGFKKLAGRADKWPVPDGPRGNLEFFVERLVRRAGPCLEAV